MDFSLSMALVDFIPVILFAYAAVILQRSFYPLLVKGAYSLLAAGTISVIAAGLMKAIWKLLYALNICNFTALNHVFFPLQTLGFVFAGIAIAWYAFSGGTGKSVIEKAGGAFAVAAAASTPKEFSGTMLFVTLMILGLLAMCIGLFIVAKRLKATKALVLFPIWFVLMLMMGYLSSRDSASAAINWSAEIVNTLGQVFMLLGILSMRKKGLGKSC